MLVSDVSLRFKTIRGMRVGNVFSLGDEKGDKMKLYLLVMGHECTFCYLKILCFLKCCIIVYASVCREYMNWYRYFH